MGYGDSVFADSGLWAQADAGPVSASGGFAGNLAFGPASSDGGQTHPLYPDTGFAWGFWLGIAGLAVLIFVRHNLPA